MILYIYFASTVLCTQELVHSKKILSSVVFHELFKNLLQIKKSDVELDQKLDFRATIDRFSEDLWFSKGQHCHRAAERFETAGNDVLDFRRSVPVKLQSRGP